MYDYKVSVRNYLDDACRQFSLAHNITELAKSVGMQPATLRNKLNPEQSHQLTLPELLAIIDLKTCSFARYQLLPALALSLAKRFQRKR